MTWRQLMEAAACTVRDMLRRAKERARDWAENGAERSEISVSRSGSSPERSEERVKSSLLSRAQFAPVSNYRSLPYLLSFSAACSVQPHYKLSQSIYLVF